MANRIATVAVLIGLSACAGQTVQSVTADAVADGQLFCSVAGTLYQAGTVKVTNATASAVAAACSALTVAGVLVTGAVPVPAASGQTAVVATVPAPVAAAVAASVPAG